MANRTGLKVTAGSTDYHFNIFQPPDQKSPRPYEIKSRAWEQGDPIDYWTRPLHPWDGGLGTDKLVSPRSYASANADLSNPGILVPPPLLQLTTAAYRETKIPAHYEGSGTAASQVVVNIGTAITASAFRPGDILVAVVITVDADAVTLANSNSMTALTTVTNGNFSMKVWHQTLDTLPGNYTFTFGATVDTFSYGIFTVRGASAVYLSDQASDSTSPYSTPSLTAVAGNAIVGIAGRAGGVFNGIPATWTSIVTSSTTDGFVSAFKDNLSAGAITGNFTSVADTAGGVYALLFTHAAPTFNTIQNSSKFVVFNSKTWTFDETGLYSVGSSNRLFREFNHSTVDITDIEVFDNELIVAMGYSESNIYLATAATPEVFTKSGDVYAKRLALVGSNLWRSTAADSVSSCLADPEANANWGATYTVGDTSYDINVLIDFNGTLWVGKSNGFYTSDINTDFWNQTPQLALWPDTTNCFGAFIAKGYLWCPSVAGLLRIRVGESIIAGPEKAQKRSMFYRVTNGAEWGDAIYLTAYDQASDSTSILKVVPDNINANIGRDYIYHEIVNVSGSSLDFFRLGFNINTGSTPCLLINNSNGIYYIDLGYSAGRYIDDNNWYYGTAWTFESGSIRPTEDLSLTTGLIGLEIVTDQSATESIDTIQYKAEEGSYTNMLTTQEGSGTMPITNTSGYAVVTRYAPANTTGQYFSFYLAGTVPSGQYGTNRPEIREMYAFGYRCSKTTDIIMMKVMIEPAAIVRNGLHEGVSSGEGFRILRSLKAAGTVVTFELPDYEESRTTRGRIVQADYEEINNPIATSYEKSIGVVTLSIMRDDFANAYAS